MNIETVKDFIEWTEGFAYVEVHDTERWWVSDDEVYWTNSEDDRDYYSSEMLEDVLRKDGLVLVNTDNGCGETITLVFLESMEVE